MIMGKKLAIIPVEVVENKIYIFRGVKVMIDRDLAELYQVETRALIQAVKRNKNRFPSDFMFQLNATELENWRSQIVISNSSLKMGLRKKPYVFTEHGVTMLASVLKSKRAVDTSILIVRTFIKLREILQSHKDILKEIEEIKRDQKKHGGQITEIIKVINKFFEQPKEIKKEKIGFKTE